MRLNESGNVEILDSNGIARYNKLGDDILTTDEFSPGVFDTKPSLC